MNEKYNKKYLQMLYDRYLNRNMLYILSKKIIYKKTINLSINSLYHNSMINLILLSIVNCFCKFIEIESAKHQHCQIKQFISL